MNAKDHPLFKQFPLHGTTTLSIGEAPTPYHIYNGYGLFIGGEGDLTAARTLLKNETVFPVQTTSGKALVGIWICNFTEASLGPHHELQFSLFVTRQQTAPLPSHPLNLLNLLLTRPDVQMMCHGLWNDTPTVVAYNRELLSLNAQRTHSQIERERGAVTFSYLDQVTRTPILSGAVQQPHQASFRANWAWMSLVGFRQVMKVAQQPWLKVEVLNPVGVVLDRNAVAESYTKNDTVNIRFFDPRADTLTFGDTPYRALQFKPHFVQYMDGFKFVYLNPK